jgi:hypothetical protein
MASSTLSGIAPTISLGAIRSLPDDPHFIFPKHGAQVGHTDVSLCYIHTFSCSCPVRSYSLNRLSRLTALIAAILSAEMGTAVGQETALSHFSRVRRTSGCTVKPFASSFCLFSCSIDHGDRTKVANSDECLYRCPFPH